jgi:hypothetical protein
VRTSRKRDLRGLEVVKTSYLMRKDRKEELKNLAGERSEVATIEHMIRYFTNRVAKKLGHE